MRFSPLQRRAMEAMGLTLLRRRTADAATALGEQGLPPRVRGSLERWVGGQWSEWPAPPGRPGDAGFKRALWRRVRDWRRGA